MITNQELKKKIKILTNKLQVGLFDEAISGGKQLLKISKDPIIVNILSIAYQAKGDYDSSIELIKNKLRSAPNNIFFLNNIGLSYLKKHELKDAEYYFKRGLEINPNYINILNNYGNLKRELNSLDEAIDYFNKALLLDNNSLEINFNLAIAYQSKGDFENSIKFLNKALEINPLFTKSDRNLSSMTNYTKDNEHFLKMKKKLLDEKLDISQKVEIHFALGKAYEDIKDYKNSFENLEKANSLMKKITQYNFENDQKLFQKIKDYFTKNIISPIKQNKIKTIFILGMPRSGTSLVEQIISSHDKVFGGGELIYMSQIINEKFLNNLDSLQDIDKLLTEAQKDYISKISNFNDKLYSFTDKSPLNFRWVGFILNMLPNSKVIHCKRDKLDVCWSNYKNQFEGTLNFSNNFQDLGQYYKIYEDLMTFWEKNFSAKIYNLNYDDLINNSDETIKKLIYFCDLEWDEKCLKHHENKRVIKTVSFNQARKPIYKSKIRNTSLYDVYLDDLKNSLNIRKSN